MLLKHITKKNSKLKLMIRDNRRYLQSLELKQELITGRIEQNKKIHSKVSKMIDNEDKIKRIILRKDELNQNFQNSQTQIEKLKIDTNDLIIRVRENNIVINTETTKFYTNFSIDPNKNKT